MAFKRILVLGAGHIGCAIAHLLTAHQYYVVLADRVAPATPPAGVTVREVDVSQPAALALLLQGADAVVNALPFHLAVPVAGAAVAAGVHYFDLTEDVAATAAIRALGAGSPTLLMPQCGLAPGLIGIVGHGMLACLARPRALRLRVGALPRHPINALRYNLTWSVDGLINEYRHSADAIADGQRTRVPALGGYERLSLEGVDYEAFNTSGGLGTLCETWEPATLDGLRALDYKSLRYPGHHAAMKLLLEDLRLAERPALLKDILVNAIPRTDQDVVVIMVAATGHAEEGGLIEAVWTRRVPGAEILGMPMTAIQRTTALSVCAVVDLAAEGALPQSGFVRQEQVGMADFLNNRYCALMSLGAGPSAGPPALSATDRPGPIAHRGCQPIEPGRWGKLRVPSDPGRHPEFASVVATARIEEQAG